MGFEGLEAVGNIPGSPNPQIPTSMCSPTLTRSRASVVRSFHPNSMRNTSRL